MQAWNFIFLARSWAADRLYLVKQLTLLGRKAEQRNTPFTFLLYPEGTLVSKDTRPLSKKYADKIGIVCVTTPGIYSFFPLTRSAARHDTHTTSPVHRTAVQSSRTLSSDTLPTACRRYYGVSWCVLTICADDLDCIRASLTSLFAQEFLPWVTDNRIIHFDQSSWKVFLHQLCICTSVVLMWRRRCLLATSP